MSSEIEPSLRDTAWQYIPTEPLNADFDHRHGLHVVTQDTQPAPELQDDANSLPAWDVAKFAELDIDLTPQDLTVLEWLASANGERTSPWMIRRFMRTKHPALTETAAGQAVRKSIRNINQSPTLPVEIRHDGNAALRQYWLANKPEQQADTVIPNLSFVRTKSSASFFVDGKELQLSPVAETVATLILDTSEHEVEYAELRRALQNNRNRMFSIREFDLILKDLDRVLARADVFFNEPRVIPEKGQYRFVGLRAVEVARPTAAVVAKTKVSTPTSAQQPAKPARVPGSYIKRVQKHGPDRIRSSCRLYGTSRAQRQHRYSDVGFPRASDTVEQ
jgi:hypothetical protein